MIKSVFDANCWSGYVDEQVSEFIGVYSTAFNIAQRCGAIYLDEGFIIKQQYLNVKRGRGEDLFDIFFNEGVIAGTIKLAKNPSDAAISSALSALGVPRKEYVYFQIAASEPCNYIISEDIDFFDPSKKNHPQKTKSRIKENSSGCVCRHFKRSGINIRNTDGFVSDLSEGH